MGTSIRRGRGLPASIRPREEVWRALNMRSANRVVAHTLLTVRNGDGSRRYQMYAKCAELACDPDEGGPCREFEERQLQSVGRRSCSIHACHSD